MGYKKAEKEKNTAVMSVPAFMRPYLGKFELLEKENRIASAWKDRVDEYERATGKHSKNAQEAQNRSETASGSLDKLSIKIMVNYHWLLNKRPQTLCQLNDIIQREYVFSSNMDKTDFENSLKNYNDQNKTNIRIDLTDDDLLALQTKGTPVTKGGYTIQNQDGRLNIYGSGTGEQIKELEEVLSGKKLKASRKAILPIAATALVMLAISAITKHFATAGIIAIGSAGFAMGIAESIINAVFSKRKRALFVWEKAAARVKGLVENGNGDDAMNELIEAKRLEEAAKNGEAPSALV